MVSTTALTTEKTTFSDLLFNTNSMATTSKITIISTTDTSADQANNNAPSLSWSRPYPPTKRDGLVHEHDKPFFYYGHLGIS